MSLADNNAWLETEWRLAWQKFRIETSPPDDVLEMCKAVYHNAWMDGSQRALDLKEKSK